MVVDAIFWIQAPKIMVTMKQYDSQTSQVTALSTILYILTSVNIKKVLQDIQT